MLITVFSRNQGLADRRFCKKNGSDTGKIYSNSVGKWHQTRWHIFNVTLSLISEKHDDEPDLEVNE